MEAESKLDFSVDEVKALTGLPEWKIMNVYLYGSRIYGTFDETSDYDFIVVANSLNREREVRDGKHNVHIYTPDKFQDDLWDYKMVNLECILAPPFARPMETIEYSKRFGIDQYRFKKSILTQSHNSWMKAKMKLREFDIDRGLKSLFHSMRILVLGTQISDYAMGSEKVLDFSSANHIWKEIIDSKEIKWIELKERFLPVKEELEENFMKTTDGNV